MLLRLGSWGAATLFALCSVRTKLESRGLQKYINKVCHCAVTLLLLRCAANSFAASPVDTEGNHFKEWERTTFMPVSFVRKRTQITSALEGCR
jgi:hypothetical protein